MFFLAFDFQEIARNRLKFPVHAQTDGHNPLVKKLLEQAMRASKPAACTTPEAQCQAAQFQGGVPGTRSMVCTFNYDEEIKCASWGGVLGFHDFRLENDGSIRAWYAYEIGPGKVFSREFLDKLWKKAEGQEDRPSQGPTNCQLVDVPPFGSAVAGAATRGKHELSRKRKRGKSVAMDERRHARAEAKRLKVEQDEANARTVLEYNKPVSCDACRTRYRFPSGLRNHACKPRPPSTAPPPLPAPAQPEPWIKPDGTSEASMLARSCVA